MATIFLVFNGLHNVFFCVQQKKETHKRLEKLKVPVKSKLS